ncbi:MAG: hypothetical protein KAX49_13095 [Halanaerobiales bacterium]|nr:hypothetical protein [Halanaerobiales bacterium]
MVYEAVNAQVKYCKHCKEEQAVHYNGGLDHGTKHGMVDYFTCLDCGNTWVETENKSLERKVKE